VCRVLTLRWGVYPVIVDSPTDVDEFFTVGEKEARKFMAGDKKGTVVLVAGTPIGVTGSTNMLRVLQLG
jgi:pyruvate kinase